MEKIVKKFCPFLLEQNIFFQIFNFHFKLNIYTTCINISGRVSRPWRSRDDLPALPLAPGLFQSADKTIGKTSLTNPQPDGTWTPPSGEHLRCKYLSLSFSRFIDLIKIEIFVKYLSPYFWVNIFLQNFRFSLHF